MITVRTIGYHENAPKTRIIGSRKSSVVRPPPRTHVTGVCRTRCFAASGRRAAPLGDGSAVLVTELTGHRGAVLLHDVPCEPASVPC